MSAIILGVRIHEAIPETLCMTFLPLGRTRFGEPYGFMLEDLSHNLLVTGLIGTGKTSFVKTVLFEASKLGVNYTVLDWEGEYRSLEPLTGAEIIPASRLSLALWKIPKGMRLAEYVHYVAGTLIDYIRSRNWTVTPRMAVAIKDAVKFCVLQGGSGPECFHNYLRKLGGRLASHQTGYAVEARLDLLIEGLLSGLTGEDDMLADAVTRKIVIDLSEIARVSRESARAVGELALARIRPQVLRRRIDYNKATYLIVLEEAEEFLREDIIRGSPIIGDMAHYRKRGAGFIIVTHGVTSINKNIALYVGNYAVFNHSHTLERKILAQLLGDPSLEREISIISRGEAIIRRVSDPFPTPIKIDLPQAPVNMREAERLIESVRTTPWLTQRERKTLLGLDGKKYYALLRSLEESGVVREISVFTGGPGRPPKLLTIKGMNPSADHEYGVYAALNTLRAAGCRAEKGGSGDPDVVASCGDLKIGIEIETGSNIIGVKYLEKLKKYDFIIVICIRKKCVRRAKRVIHSLGNDRIIYATLYSLRASLHRISKRDVFAFSR